MIYECRERGGSSVELRGKGSRTANTRVRGSSPRKTRRVVLLLKPEGEKRNGAILGKAKATLDIRGVFSREKGRGHEKPRPQFTAREGVVKEGGRREIFFRRNGVGCRVQN